MTASSTLALVAALTVSSATFEDRLRAEGLAPIDKSYRGATFVHPQQVTALPDREPWREFLLAGRFPTPRHRRVWALFVIGHSRRAIVGKFRSSGDRISKTTVRSIVAECMTLSRAYHTDLAQAIEEIAAAQSDVDAQARKQARAKQRRTPNLWRPKDG